MEADVVVVGAGAAGLAAARRLANAGLKVVVLEARGRIGGRVHWATVGGEELYAELGAEFIHGEAQQTHALLHEINDRAREISGDSYRFVNGALIKETEDAFFSAGKLFEEACGLEPDQTVDQYLARFSSTEQCDQAELARAFVEGFDAADPAIASARSIAEEWASGADSSIRPLNGYAPVFDFLHQRCVEAGVRFLLNTPARQISWEPQDVRINGVRARAAIITLPVGVLRDGFRFDPPLPSEKQHALSLIESGAVVKVALAFRTRFWERLEDGRFENAGFFRIAEGDFQVYWTQLPVLSRVITAWAGGPKATRLSKLPQQQVVDLALSGLTAMFGDPVRAEYDGARMHDWGSDPYAQGAYSFIRVGGTQARSMLAAPIGQTLFFAGEACAADGDGGTVDGALQTGERAAKEVLSLRNRKR